jgi:hypothetical protein
MKKNKFTEVVNSEAEYLKVANKALTMKTLDSLKDIIFNMIKRGRYGNIVSYNEIKNTIGKLIIILYRTIKRNIYEEYNEIDEILITYKNSQFIPERDAVLLYNILYLIFSKFPDKSFTVSKYLISKKYSYFVYKLTFKYDVKYVVFEYPHKYNQNFLYIFHELHELKSYIEKIKKAHSLKSLSSQSSLQNSSFSTNYSKSSNKTPSLSSLSSQSSLQNSSFSTNYSKSSNKSSK